MGGAMTENAKAMIDVPALGVAMGRFSMTEEEREVQATLSLSEIQEVARACRFRSRMWLKQAKVYETLGRYRNGGE
jgi:hypothetical protein